MNTLDIRSKTVDRAAPQGLFLIILSLLVLSAAPALTATPKILLGGDVNAGGELTIGGHLDVGVINGEPLRRYTVMLVDEDDQAVTATVDVMTDGAGKTGRHRLWKLTGVVGCDPEAIHDPASYQFESFAEAESELDGRTFRVLLLDGPGSPPGKAHAKAELPLVVVTPFVTAYPSDNAGCLRTRFKPGEDVYLAISHQDAVDQTFQIYVVEYKESWKDGMPLNDVRPVGQQPQSVLVPANVDPWVAPLWASPVAGDYQLIVRHGMGTVQNFSSATDVAVDIGFSPGGSTNDECDPCPPPQVGGP